VFLGDSLGGRPEASELYDADGHDRYDLVARSPAFESGLDRLIAGAEQQRVAVMCSEENPSHCHRRLLIARALEGRAVSVAHLRRDGSAISEEELVEAERADQMSLFGEEDPRPWKSIRSVSRNGPPRGSSEP
jgi:uncharacterized protein (DUF488 family)